MPPTRRQIAPTEPRLELLAIVEGEDLLLLCAAAGGEHFAEVLVALGAQTEAQREIAAPHLVLEPESAAFRTAGVGRLARIVGGAEQARCRIPGHRAPAVGAPVEQLLGALEAGADIEDVRASLL